MLQLIWRMGKEIIKKCAEDTSNEHKTSDTVTGSSNSKENYEQRKEDENINAIECESTRDINAAMMMNETNSSPINNSNTAHETVSSDKNDDVTRRIETRDDEEGTVVNTSNQKNNITICKYIENLLDKKYLFQVM